MTSQSSMSSLSKPPSPDAISAISQTVAAETRQEKPIISAASFPDDDPVQVNPELFRAKTELTLDLPENLPKLDTQLVLNNRYESDPTDAAFM